MSLTGFGNPGLILANILFFFLKSMKFGIFYEHQLPNLWGEGKELKLFQDALEQIELADRIGIDYAWEVEHHFLEEYSHSSPRKFFLLPRPSARRIFDWAMVSAR